MKIIAVLVLGVYGACECACAYLNANTGNEGDRSAARWQFARGVMAIIVAFVVLF